MNLISHGVDINNISETNERIPSILACDIGNLQIFECLLEKGANPNEVSSTGLSILKNVLNFGYPFNTNVELTVELLFLYGADVNIISPNGHNVFFFFGKKSCNNIILQHVA